MSLNGAMPTGRKITDRIGLQTGRKKWSKNWSQFIAKWLNFGLSHKQSDRIRTLKQTGRVG